MDDPAEAIAALHRSRRQRDHVGRLTGPALLDPLVRTGLVVVVDELHQHDAVRVTAHLYAEVPGALPGGLRHSPGTGEISAAAVRGSRLNGSLPAVTGAPVLPSALAEVRVVAGDWPCTRSQPATTVVSELLIRTYAKRLKPGPGRLALGGDGCSGRSAEAV